MFYSIVIPLYNKESFIKRTLEKVLNQSFIDFEVIVVDDGSTDESVNVVKNIKDDRIKIFSKTNGGVSSARNYGIKKASGKYIAFLDADDWWSSDYLDKMHQVIISEKAHVYCCCNAEVISPDRIIVNPVKSLLNHEISELDYQKTFLSTMSSPIHTSAVIISHEVLNKYQFDEKLIMGEDLILWLTITSRYKCLIYNEILSFYNRLDENSATRKLVPFENTFIRTLHDWNISCNKYDKRLLTRLILNMIKPYYLFRYNKEIKNIIKSCRMEYATLLQRIIYQFLPRIVAKNVYYILKRLT